MEVLTEDVTRLRDEIVAWRNRRRELVTDLVKQTENRRADVSAFCTHLAADLAAMAQGAKAARSSSLARLRHATAVHQEAMRLDLAGARRAWGGLFPTLDLPVESGTGKTAGAHATAESVPRRLRTERSGKSEAGAREPDAEAVSRRRGKAHGKRK